MPRDALLRLHNGVVDNTGTTTPIEIDGGTFAIVELLFTADAEGTSPTLDAEFQVSLDGINYLTLCTFPQFSDAANKGDAGTHIAMACYIPRSDANPNARGVDTRVKARLSFTAGGTTPKFHLKSWVSHLSSQPYGSVAGFTSGKAGRYGPLDAIAYFD